MTPLICLRRPFPAHTYTTPNGAPQRPLRSLWDVGASATCSGNAARGTAAHSMINLFAVAVCQSQKLHFSARSRPGSPPSLPLGSHMPQKEAPGSTATALKWGVGRENLVRFVWPFAEPRAFCGWARAGQSTAHGPAPPSPFLG
jgi:hypothetical protein